MMCLADKPKYKFLVEYSANTGREICEICFNRNGYVFL